MQIQQTHPIWKRIVLGQLKLQLQSLSVRIALGNIQLKLKLGRDGYNVDTAVSDIFNVFQKGENMPSVKADIQTILKNC